MATLNERQAECLHTCLDSCLNLAYPTFEEIEEHGEYIEKLLPLLEWNKDFKQKDYVISLLKGLVHIGKCLGAIGKDVRHGNQPLPFHLVDRDSFNDPEVFDQALRDVLLEHGDMAWGNNVANFFLTNPDGSVPGEHPLAETHPHGSLSAQLEADLNRQKLASRFKDGTIDGKGDHQRTSL